MDRETLAAAAEDCMIIWIPYKHKAVEVCFPESTFGVRVKITRLGPV